jgi:hypothetical protein
MKYREGDRNQLANCMLLSREENGAGGKSDTPPVEWFAGKDDAYLEKHLIPRDRDLWQLDRYEDFIKARKSLLVEHFRKLRLLPVAAVSFNAPQEASASSCILRASDSQS